MLGSLKASSKTSTIAQKFVKLSSVKEIVETKARSKKTMKLMTFTRLRLKLI